MANQGDELLQTPAFNPTPTDPGKKPTISSVKQLHENALTGNPLYQQYRTDLGLWQAQKNAYDNDPRTKNLSANFNNTPKVVNEYLKSLKEQYTPIMGDYSNDIGNLDIVGGTRQDMTTQQGLLAGRNQREAARYGTNNIDPATAAYAKYQGDLGNSATAAGMLNNARMQQNDMAEGGRRQLINLGRGMTQDALAGAGIASGSQARMDQMSAQMDAQQKAQNAQMAAAAGMMLLAFLA